MRGQPDRIMTGSKLAVELTERCRVWRGTEYPPPGVNDSFNGALSRLALRSSAVHGKGVFVGKGTLKKSELLGSTKG